MLTDCISWMKAKDAQGYGKAWNGKIMTQAHRLAYPGEIPPGLQIHHICERKDCVNPDHLILVTSAEHHAEHRSEVCKKGHSMSNAYVRRDGRRHCRVCRNEAKRRYYWKARNAV